MRKNNAIGWHLILWSRGGCSAVPVGAGSRGNRVGADRPESRRSGDRARPHAHHGCKPGSTIGDGGLPNGQGMNSKKLAQPLDRTHLNMPAFTTRLIVNWG
jgi:hypothetical protein